MLFSSQLGFHPEPSRYLVTIVGCLLLQGPGDGGIALLTTHFSGVASSL